MNILFLARYFYPHIGGVEKHVLRVGEELVKKGHQVTVLTQKHSRKLADSVNLGGIKVIRIPFCQSKWGIWKNLWPLRRLFRQADIIHCHDIFFWYLPFRFLYPTKPVFTTFHGWEGKFPLPQKNIWLRKIWEKLSWGNICVGDYLCKWYGTKTDFITYGGVDLPDFQFSKSNFPEYIFIGRLEEDLGLSEYLQVFKKLPVVFIGAGSLKSKCAKVGRTLGKVKDLSVILKQRPYVFAASYLTIWEALAYGCSVFSLYQNPLKKDYLEKFPAAANIHVSGSAGELISQLNQPRPLCRRFPSWQDAVKLYQQLWQQ